MVSLVLTVLRSLAAALHTRRHLVLENLALRVSVRPGTYRSDIAEQFDVVMLSTSMSQC